MSKLVCTLSLFLGTVAFFWVGLTFEYQKVPILIWTVGPVFAVFVLWVWWMLCADLCTWLRRKVKR